jgi:hypothetical protein
MMRVCVQRDTLAVNLRANQIYIPIGHPGGNSTNIQEFAMAASASGRPDRARSGSLAADAAAQAAVPVGR